MPRTDSEAEEPRKLTIVVTVCDDERTKTSVMTPSHAADVKSSAKAKQRVPQLCLPQKVISLLPYSGHCSKKVLNRLNKPNICGPLYDSENTNGEDENDNTFEDTSKSEVATSLTSSVNEALSVQIMSESTNECSPVPPAYSNISVDDGNKESDIEANENTEDTNEEEHFEDVFGFKIIGDNKNYMIELAFMDDPMMSLM
uniref:Uncharacterized protein n=1 Tax=Amphimedon queenslandica TaxID=400682 RepID=A0A1X7U4K1_AMPQE